VTDRESHWAELMRAAKLGDAGSYHRLLHELAPALRGVARRGFARYGLGSEDVEDVVQETLLAVHLKRHTWDERRPVLTWVRAIAHNKLIDNLRRRGRRVHVPLDEVSETLAASEQPADTDSVDAERVITSLKGRQRDIVLAISVEGESARQVAQRLNMTEGAVRVALHRALQSLARAFRSNPP
jgi:RNA polymerase sigma-70 factor (ECF subfamily)